MESFLKPFVESRIVYSLENVPVNTDDSTAFNYVKFLQKTIFKHDVFIEFKKVLNSACIPEPITIKNEIVKKLIGHLNLLLHSKASTGEKAEVFRLILESFSSLCKGDDNVFVVRFFIILSHLLGMNELINENSETEGCITIINVEDFNKAFEVDILKPSLESFSIFKELLLSFSKLSFNFNSSELQVYSKWLQLLIKKLAYHHPLQEVLLDIFSIFANIDLRLVEGNLENIFCNVLSQRPPIDETFCESYNSFVERALETCSKFQRTPQFITKFLSSIKSTPCLLVKEIILPAKLTEEFSKIVAVASNQQCLSLFEILIQNLDYCFKLISENSGCNPLLFFTTSELLFCFFKEVKLYAPSIAQKTLQTFIDKLNNFKLTLQNFGDYVFNDTSFIIKNESIAKTFLELCLYCGEVELLVNCYKDSLLQQSEATPTATEYDWHCCVKSEQWTNLISVVSKSKLEDVGSVCFQLGLHKCRELKLKNSAFDVDESTLKILFSQLTSTLKKFNIFQQLPPEDLTILMEVLTTKQSRSVCKKIYKQLVGNSKEAESVAWLSDLALQENSVFVLNLFSQILKETGSVLQDLIPEKTHSKMSWLLDEYFDDSLNISPESVETLPDKMLYLLKFGKKIRKFVSSSPEQMDLIVKILQVFKLLPIPFIKGDCQRLGLCFAVKMGVLLSEDEACACVGFESICKFLSSDVDPSTCFDVGLFVKWLSELYYEDKKADDLRMKVIGILVRNSPNMKFGLTQMSEMINSIESSKGTTQIRTLEGPVVLYNELGKCWQRAKKRAADNDLIGSCRVKLAKIISEESKQFQDNTISSENSKILLKIFAIELNKAIKANDENEISVLMAQKFPSHFDFAVNTLKRNFDEASSSFLIVVLQLMPQIKKFLPEDALFKTWKALRFYDKCNMRLFCNNSTDEEFLKVLDDLVKVSKKFLNSESEKHSSNCFEIWVSFFEFSSESKRNQCQLRLQDFFNYIHNCEPLLKDLPIKKKIILVKFCSFCASQKEVILTSLMLDTIIHLMVECSDDTSSVEDFCSLFTLEVETASAVVLKRFDWSRVHLLFILFKVLLASLIKRCDVGQLGNQEDVFKLSTCAFGLEKWVSLLVEKEKDFAPTTPYFITTLISSVASVTVLPAIKIHLVNCINHFLSISDSHTVSHLLRILKPGYQQVFNSMYTQFKKYHKYSGKV